ncbi:MAG TPA: Do family serine endopeptidase [Persephonella sp.]|uniref:Protease do n=1 Tax=Persephonella marina (strain DSM 14350 / EX-H1) TaxID=123214 RepID=C0QRD7_PERMH|nr:MULTISPECIES: Do family serine endopeptidase [Persephonella]ACO04848.1 protease do [Persephonella marina EX-H1]HCB68979.1 Do family serine endopeptidase [Persephonella sp.]
MLKKHLILIFTSLMIFNISFASTLMRQIEEERIKLVENVSPGVATVFTIREVKMVNPFAGTPFGDFFGFPDEREFTQRQEGLGSAFIVKIDKKKKLVYLLTNNHVIENATNIKVRFKNNKVIEAKVIGKDKLSDLAVIAVPFKKGIDKYAEKHILKLGDSDKLRVGATVIAIGSPLGLSGTVTMGIVSALDRAIEGHPGEGFIQTDAAINPGNSGGPLINLEGEVVGINTAIIAGAQGLGFAVPINQAKWVMNQILKYGKVKRSKIGVIIQPLTPELAEHFGVDKGVLVSQVMEDGPAKKAGIKSGDIIVAVNGKEVEDINDLQKLIMRNPPGTEVTVTVIRNGRKIDIKVKTVPWEETVSVENMEEMEAKYGLIVQDITPEMVEKYRIPKIPYGVFVYGVKYGSVADEAGLRSGDIILSVNRKPVKSANEFWNIIKKAEAADKETVLLFVQRGNSKIYTVLPILKGKD